MNVLKMAASYLNPWQPSYLIPFVTARCNARCSFCFYGREVEGAGHGEEELSADEFLMISRRCGNIPYLLVSGGEPVLRDDLDEIISGFVENAGAQYITVPSNGLSRERTLRLFSDLTRRYPGRHFRAAFSVDYPDERHDRSRGVPGCLETLLSTADGINRLKRQRGNLTMDIVTVYMNDPEQDHTELRRWVRNLIHPDNHELHVIRPDWPELIVPGLQVDDFLKEAGAYRCDSSQRENRKFSSFFRGLNKLYIKGLKKTINGGYLARCTAGRKFTVITEKGDVRLCELRDDVLGNLRDSSYDLKAVLARSGDVIRRMNRNRCTCTWECAVSCNLVCNPRFLTPIAIATVRQFLWTGRR